MNNLNKFPNLWQSVLLVLVFVMTMLWINLGLNFTSTFTKIDFQKNSISIALASLGAFATTIGVIFLWGNFSIKPIFKTGFELKLLPSVISGFAGLHFLVSEIDNLIQYFLPAPESLRNITEKLFANEPSIILFMSIVIIAPAIEEIFFRGIILKGLLANNSRITALLISSLLFGFSHINPWMIIPTGIIGFALGWVYIRTGSIWLCILCHALNNLASFALSALKIEIPGYTSFGADKFTHQFQPLALDVTGCALLIFGFLTFYKLTMQTKICDAANNAINKSFFSETSNGKPPIISEHNKQNEQASSGAIYHKELDRNKNER